MEDEEAACLSSLQTCSLPVPLWRQQGDGSYTRFASLFSLLECDQVTNWVNEPYSLKNWVGVSHMPCTHKATLCVSGSEAVGVCENVMLPPVCVEETVQPSFV